jgi:hypothetical protein
VDASRKTVGCGEHFPRAANPVSNGNSGSGPCGDAADRRVEILFFEPGEEPKLDCHAGAGRCVPAVCEIYNRRRYILLSLAVGRNDAIRGFVLRIELQNEVGELLLREPYTLEVDGNVLSKPDDRTDDQGRLEHEVPSNARHAVIKTQRHVWNLSVGVLGPLEQATAERGLLGAQQRLCNLAYLHQEPSGELDAATSFALCCFQSEAEIEAVARLDGPTCARLVEVHKK